MEEHYIKLLLEKIERLEKEVEELKSRNITGTQITVGEFRKCNHEYPTPWMSVLPPHCLKCGDQYDPLVYQQLYFQYSGTKSF